MTDFDTMLRDAALQGYVNAHRNLILAEEKVRACRDGLREAMGHLIDTLARHHGLTIGDEITDKNVRDGETFGRKGWVDGFTLTENDHGAPALRVKYRRQLTSGAASAQQFTTDTWKKGWD